MKVMKISGLNKEYDKLQLKYGAKELTSIYNGGRTNNPDFCFVFMNPTGKNIASDPTWKGRRSPWIGTKNIWKLFYKIGLLDEEIYMSIMSKKPQEWNEEFADLVYDDVEKHKYFITNLGKCTQVDARVLPNSVYSQYLDLLCKEIEIINPKTKVKEIHKVYCSSKKTNVRLVREDANHNLYNDYVDFQVTMVEE